MTRSIYVLAPEGLTGKSVVALGILDALTREVESVGVFRPLIAAGEQPDQILSTLVHQPVVHEDYDEAFGVTYEDVRADADTALATILQRYNDVASRYDTMVILGSDYTDNLGAQELQFNARVAANLNSPIALAVSAKNRTPEEVTQLARSTVDLLHKHHASVIAVIPTRTPEGDQAPYSDAIRAALPDVVVGTLPAHPVLAAPTIGAQVKAINGRQVAGRTDVMSQESQSVLVAAMTLPNVLSRLEPESTVISPGDRTEIIPGIILAQRSGAFPPLAALVLTGGYEIHETMAQLIANIRQDLPIFVTDVAMSEGCTSTRTVRSVASVTYTAPLGATATAWAPVASVSNRTVLTTAEVAVLITETVSLPLVKSLINPSISRCWLMHCVRMAFQRYWAVS